MGKGKRKAPDDDSFKLVRFSCSGVEPPEELSLKKGFVYPLDSADVCASGCTKCVCMIPEYEERDSDRWFYQTCSRLGLETAPLVLPLAQGRVPENLVVAPHPGQPAKKHCIAFLRAPNVKMVYVFNVSFLKVGDKTVHELSAINEVDRRAAFGNLMGVLDDAKGDMGEGIYLRLCKAAKAAYDRSAPAED